MFVKSENGELDNKKFWKRKRREWWILAACLLVILYLGLGWAHRTLLQQGLAEKVLRFHVLANSDSEEDQAVKLQVRDEVLEWLEEKQTEEKQMGERQIEEEQGTATRADTIQFLQAYKNEIQELANAVLKKEGKTYTASVELANCYFSERTYGTDTFPAGWYDALRICLGEARGHNWWGLLYPELGTADCLRAVSEDGQMTPLRETLTAEAYESLIRDSSQWKISFRWLKWFN